MYRTTLMAFLDVEKFFDKYSLASSDHQNISAKDLYKLVFRYENIISLGRV